MSTRLTASAMVCVLVVCFWQSSGMAAEEFDYGTSTETGTVAVGVGVELAEGPTRTGAPVSRPRCTWKPFTPLPEFPILPGGGVEQMLAQAAANDATLYTKTCPNGAGTISTWSLVPNGVRVEDLIASASARVSARLPSPSVNMSPDPSVGGIVNIGLWMAVADPGQVSITASVGPVWATVTARYERTVWEMGNGDVIDCAGVGTPISDLDTVEQGPCGYTYRWPSAPKFTGAGLAYQASVTGHWVITFATSSGGSGTLAPIARSTEFDYQVREIQTVRVAADG